MHRIWTWFRPLSNDFHARIYWNSANRVGNHLSICWAAYGNCIIQNIWLVLLTKWSAIYTHTLWGLICLLKNDIITVDVERLNIALLNENLGLINTNADANVYINYIRLLRQNINDDYTWRLFKGRLYTRLHDKRISELNLNAIANLSVMFLSLIQSITQPMEPV